MKILFSEAQLSRPQQNSLIKILDVLQSENENELEVTVVEFPYKLMVKLDDDIGMLLGWDSEKQSYAGLTKPEPEPEQLKGESLTDDKSAIQEPEPEPELDLSPVFERAEALANAFVNLTKPLITEHRVEVWVRFCIILSKELWK